MGMRLLYLLYLLSGCIVISAAQIDVTIDPGDVNVCQAFCDVQGFLHPVRVCGVVEFCCGTQNIRYCCSDEDLRVEYPAETSCSRSSWQFYQRLIIGMLLSLIAMLVLMICCFYCCTSETYLATQRARRRQREMAEFVTGPDNNSQFPVQFDPESPYAFEPPEYDSLPKDPPLYGDVFGDSASVHTATESGPAEEPQSAVGSPPATPATVRASPQHPGTEEVARPDTSHHTELQAGPALGQQNSGFIDDHVETRPDPGTTSGGATGAARPADASAAVAALKHSKHKGQSAGACLPSQKPPEHHGGGHDTAENPDSQIAPPNGTGSVTRVNVSPRPGSDGDAAHACPSAGSTRDTEGPRVDDTAV